MLEELFGNADEPEDGGTDDPPEPAEEVTTETEPETEPAPGADERGIEELEGRIDELVDQIDRNQSSVEAVQGTQEDLGERLDDLDDQIRRLLGVYDQLTGEVNPLTGDDPPAEPDATATEQGNDGAETEGFGVVDADEPVSFDDLTSAGSVPAEEGDGRDHHGAGDGEAHGGGANPHRPQAAPGSAAVAADAASPAAGAPAAESTSQAVLSQVPRTYAADIVVFEWLSMLIARAGPAAAFQALDYYEEIGWIAPEVREYLESVLAGPGLDVDLDPSSPSSLSADDHARSNEFVARLAAITEAGLEG